MKIYYACYQCLNGVFDRVGTALLQTCNATTLLLAFPEFESVRGYLFYGYGKIFLQGRQ